MELLWKMSSEEVHLNLVTHHDILGSFTLSETEMGVEHNLCLLSREDTSSLGCWVGKHVTHNRRRAGSKSTSDLFVTNAASGLGKDRVSGEGVALTQYFAGWVLASIKSFSRKTYCCTPPINSGHLS